MKNGEFAWYSGFGRVVYDWVKAQPDRKPPKYSKLRVLWFRIAPEFWRTHRRRRSHLRYLDKATEYISGIPTYPAFRTYFGSQSHIADETVRALRLPPLELLPFDGKRKNTIRKMIKDAVELHRGSTKSEG